MSALKIIGIVTGFLLSLVVFAAFTGGPEPLEELEAAPPSSLTPYRELTEMFGYMNDHTDTQRENAKKKVIGKIVQWRLPVYEVTHKNKGYEIQTAKSRFARTFIYMEPRDDRERHFIEAMKAGDIIHFKGKIDDIFMRSFIIKPAILVDRDEPETATAGEDNDALAIPEKPAANLLPKQE